MIFTIAGKELKALFASPLAWVVLTLVQIILGYAFLRRLDDFLQLQPQLVQMANPPGATELVAAPLFGTTAALLLFAVPVLAMRLIAEERRNQTMVLLMSAPVSMTEIVLGKFLGLLAFLLVLVALTVLMPLSLAGATRLDYGLLAGLAAGLAAAGRRIRRGGPARVLPHGAPGGGGDRRLRRAARHGADGRRGGGQPARARLDGGGELRAGVLPDQEFRALRQRRARHLGARLPRSC